MTPKIIHTAIHIPPCLLYTSIKKNYLLAYLISVDIWLFLHPELNVIYSEDEIAYFTIHIQYSLMRNPVSYTHLDVYKRQVLYRSGFQGLRK